jgi:acyl carrier protein
VACVEAHNLAAITGEDVMMDLRQVLFERVQRVFRETLDDNSLKITKDTTQIDLSEWDSKFQVTLIMAIENEFDVRLSAKDASQLVSVSAILDLLETKGLEAQRTR